MNESEETARAKILGLLEQDPRLSASELSTLCGVSRQRIYQVIGKRNGWKPADGRKRAKQYCQPPLKVGNSGLPFMVTAGNAGQIAEFIVIADLLARGYVSFYPFSRGAPFDLVAVSRKMGVVLIMAVRTGKRNDSGSLIFRKNETQSATLKKTFTPDHYAVVCFGEPVIYVPELRLPEK